MITCLKHNLVNGGTFYVCTECHRDFDDTGTPVFNDQEQGILDSFKYHQPSPEVAVRIAAVRNACIDCAKLIIRNVKPSADRTVALRKLHEAMMNANKSLVLEP